MIVLNQVMHPADLSHIRPEQTYIISTQFKHGNCKFLKIFFLKKVQP